VGFKVVLSSLNKVVGISIILLSVAGCSKDQFAQKASSQFFLQDYNPAYLDVLWMVDNRSPMFRVRDHLIGEAQNFFARLDATASVDYQMAFVSADMQFAQGRLEPETNPVPLTKTLGTLDQRIADFGDIISQIINLQTGAIDQGLESARVALTRYFQPRSGVPLVLVFISDSDDHSVPPNSVDPVTYYTNAFLSLKGNNADMIRVYSINYEPLPDGADPADPKWDSERCATRYDADIDSTGFVKPGKYFALAEALHGGTADLCGSFSNQIDLTGLQLKQLPTIFHLEQTPVASSIGVSITDANQNDIQISWTYDAAGNNIVFQTAPPAGTTIQVTFTPR
jgi:hypothetical protein